MHTTSAVSSELRERIKGFNLSDLKDIYDGRREISVEELLHLVETRLKPARLGQGGRLYESVTPWPYVWVGKYGREISGVSLIHQELTLHKYCYARFFVPLMREVFASTPEDVLAQAKWFTVERLLDCDHIRGISGLSCDYHNHHLAISSFYA